MAAILKLPPELQETLDELSRREFQSAAGAKLDDLLLSRPTSEEGALREAIGKLQAVECVTLDGFEGSQVVNMTRFGILASDNFEAWDRVGQQLLSYLGQRLQSEGSEFEYTWSELKAWGAHPADYPAYLRVIDIFRLSGGGGFNRSAKDPSFSFRLPAFKVKLRAIRDLTALNALLDQRDKEIEAERRAAQRPQRKEQSPPQNKQSPVEKTSKSSKAYGGRWETLEAVGEGGQAHVYRVKDLEGGPDRILKRLKNKKRLNRFAQELEAIQRLEHPNVIGLIDYNLDDKQPYLVVEFMPGGSLGSLLDGLNGVPLELCRALKLFEEICEGVCAAHNAGITHRDLKPENILLGDPERAVVADFGICHIDDGSRITLTEEAMGPRLYMAPELEDGRADDVSPASDVYSLGKVLWTMLGGRQVFSREKHRTPDRNLVALRWHDSLEHINLLLDKMIVPAPEDRYQSAGEVLPALRRARDLMRHDYRALSPKLKQRCRYCGEGFYTPAARTATQLRNFGVTPAGRDGLLRIMACDECGHIEFFRVDLAKRKDWWGESS